MTGDWNFPTRIRFGPGRLSELGAACRELGMTRPLLVTDPGLVELPPVQAALQALAALEPALFRDVRSNPTEENVMAGVGAFHRAGCDGVVALGGGSSLDAGKAVALMVGQERPLFDFEDAGDNHLRVKVEGMAPVVAVPTTAGTGSEVGRVSVITDTATRSKRLIFHPRMLPGRVVADPELTLGLPPSLTAAVGMDALAHNLEAYCSPVFHPMAEAIALEGMRLISNSLLRAYRDGGDLAARSDMLAASLMGAVAFQKGLGAVHSLSHPLGGRYDLHHGLLNGILLPYVLEFNRPALTEKLDRLANHLGVDPEDWLKQLRRELSIPSTLSEVGVTEDDVEELAASAGADPSAATNPVPLDDDAHRHLLLAAIRGTR